MLSCLLVLTFAGYLGTTHNWCELASHFRAQYSLGALVLLVTFVAFNAWFWSAGALLILLINSSRLVPFYFPRAPARIAPKRQRLKLILQNVEYKNVNYDPFIKLVKEEKPDILVVQEPDSRWIGQLNGLGNQYPYSKLFQGELGAGLALYCRTPIEMAEEVHLAGNERPGILVRIDLGFAKISLLTIHPPTPLLRAHFHQRNQQLSEAAYILQGIEANKVLVGDLNTSSWSPFFSRLIRQTGLVDVRRGFGLLPTWPTRRIWLACLMIPIDHCLVSRDISVISARTGRQINSDHLPLIVELGISVTD
jgi:endonuclease/exonuclease/phosphatase (EEP) superfamily protein YafD